MVWFYFAVIAVVWLIIGTLVTARFLILRGADSWDDVSTRELNTFFIFFWFPWTIGSLVLAWLVAT
jgi:hypothetical protein